MIPVSLTARQARRIWLAAQKLDQTAPFGAGTDAVARAIAHLGYVQIDTINVVERCHHHILWSRIPDYRRTDLAQAQSHDKSVFEYWTHALSYVATADIRFFLPDMRDEQIAPLRWHGPSAPVEVRKVLRRIRRDGAISMRDVDDAPVDKTHLWASRKPTKRVLQGAFYRGQLAISERNGMLKSYELFDRHFGWPPRPRPATPNQVLEYRLERALRAQGIVSIESACYMDTPRKAAMKALLDKRVRARRLVPVVIKGAEKVPHWASPEALEGKDAPLPGIVHILSPFDPLIIQRKRTAMIFDYDHMFEAYVPAAKRQLGYFTLPVLIDDEIVAGLDLKTDRAAGKLLIQAWHWFGSGRARAHKRQVEEALHRFERFQLAA